MRKQGYILIASAITFLFFIQMAGTLVESIYILNLLNTALDEKALGLFFFFSPILLVILRGKIPSWFPWLIFGLLFLARGITPYLNTPNRLFTSGIGTSAVLLLFPILLISELKDQKPSRTGPEIAAGLALGVGLSVLLRTIYFSIDYSMTASGSWVGWILGLLLGLVLLKLEINWQISPEESQQRRITSSILGLFLVLTLVYFIFSAPATLVRWTEGNYPLIVSATSLGTLGWVFLSLSRPGRLYNLSSRTLFVLNGLFTSALFITIMVHRIPFPLSPASDPVVVVSTTLIQQVPTFFMLLLYPVIFVDFRFFVSAIKHADPKPRDFLPGMILGSFVLILLVFMSIFTNVWGYVDPVSPPFRNMFWLPFALVTILLTILSTVIVQKSTASYQVDTSTNQMGWGLILAVIFLLTSGYALQTTRTTAADANVDSLLVMTYNIQAANDQGGEKAYERQLALISQVSPDILALQESDTARISLNNNDYVRFFAGKLGYYSYFGPRTVTGTYGTAILSRFPLRNTHSIFSYSDQDEIGTSVAEVEVGGLVFTIFNVHPAGSDSAMTAFANSLLDHANGKDRVISLGDYNLRDDEIPYQLLDAVLTNAWISVYPTGISESGTDMSGRNRIDHIFLSPDLRAVNPVYLLPPDSHTDHPAHWSWVVWSE